MAFVPDNLDSLKYAGLQQLAKQCGVKANMKVSDVRSGRGYFADCGMRKVVNGWFVENQVRNVPQITLIAFPHSAAEKFRISADRKTTGNGKQACFLNIYLNYLIFLLFIMLLLCGESMPTIIS